MKSCPQKDRLLGTFDPVHRLPFSKTWELPVGLASALLPLPGLATE
jgi:hypothetical protein